MRLLLFILFSCFSTVLTLDLFPNDEKELIGVTSVQLLQGEEWPTGRGKREVIRLPGTLAFQFSVGGQKIVLNLKKNPDLTAHLPAFLVRRGKVVSDRSHDTLENLGFYQDVTKGAAIMVKREFLKGANYELMGTYVLEEEQFAIQPIRDHPVSGSPRSVTNHSISRLMTHFSLRNDILDFVQGPQVEVTAQKRHKREAVVNTVELLLVTDFAIYNTWYQMAKGSSVAERRRTALDNMKQYYAFVINGIDLRYASIKEADFRIKVSFAGIVMIDNPDESPWTVGLTQNEGKFVESSDALESFRSWVLNNDTSFPAHDHVMLFTGYNLTYGGSTANAGLAYIKSMCNPEFSISIVEEYFEFRIVAIAAHELGHSLGARHDMDGNKCFAFFLYIMTSRFRFPTRSKATNPWRFSRCSIDYFRKYIETLNTNGTNCMLTRESNANPQEIAGFLGDQPGQMYSADQQCQVRYQSSEAHVCRDLHKGKYTTVCSQGLYCRVPDGSGRCEKIVPADGTPCDSGKWCMGGKCIATAEPIDWISSCPLGDIPGPLQDGAACAEVVSSGARSCYNQTVYLQCCDSCAMVFTGIKDCDYGDRQLDCQADLCPTYPFDVQNVSCCGTCHNFFYPTTPTTPGTTLTSPTSTLTTKISADVVAPTTPSHPSEQGGFNLSDDVSTKSEKLMKSELMPTSQVVSMSTSTPLTTISASQTTVRFETSVTIPSQGTSAPSLTRSTTSIVDHSTPRITSRFISVLSTSTSGAASQSATTNQQTLNTLSGTITSSRYHTTPSPSWPSVFGGIPRVDNTIGMPRQRWSLAALRKLRRERIRQRQDMARRRWLFYYTLLQQRRVGNHVPLNRFQRRRQLFRGNRRFIPNLSWELSMEMDMDEDEQEHRRRQYPRRRQGRSLTQAHEADGEENEQEGVTETDTEMMEDGHGDVNHEHETGDIPYADNAERETEAGQNTDHLTEVDNEHEADKDAHLNDNTERDADHYPERGYSDMPHDNNPGDVANGDIPNRQAVENELNADREEVNQDERESFHLHGSKDETQTDAEKDPSLVHSNTDNAEGLRNTEEEGFTDTTGGENNRNPSPHLTNKLEIAELNQNTYIDINGHYELNGDLKVQNTLDPFLTEPEVSVVRLIRHSGSETNNDDNQISDRQTGVSDKDRNSSGGERHTVKVGIGLIADANIKFHTDQKNLKIDGSHANEIKPPKQSFDGAQKSSVFGHIAHIRTGDAVHDTAGSRGTENYGENVQLSHLPIPSSVPQDISLFNKHVKIRDSEYSDVPSAAPWPTTNTVPYSSKLHPDVSADAHPRRYQRPDLHLQKGGKISTIERKSLDVHGQKKLKGDVSFQMLPDYVLHKPETKSHAPSPDSARHFTYKIIDVDPKEEDKQESWIFHAMIDPSMIPIQTRWINMQRKHRERMMPFQGEPGSPKMTPKQKPKHMLDHSKPHFKQDRSDDNSDPGQGDSYRAKDHDGKGNEKNDHGFANTYESFVKGNMVTMTSKLENDNPNKSLDGGLSSLNRDTVASDIPVNFLQSDFSSVGHKATNKEWKHTVNKTEHQVVNVMNTANNTIPRDRKAEIYNSKGNPTKGFNYNTKETIVQEKTIKGFVGIITNTVDYNAATMKGNSVSGKGKIYNQSHGDEAKSFEHITYTQGYHSADVIENDVSSFENRTGLFDSAATGRQVDTSGQDDSPDVSKDGDEGDSSTDSDSLTRSSEESGIDSADSHEVYPDISTNPGVAPGFPRRL